MSKGRYIKYILFASIFYANIVFCFAQSVTNNLTNANNYLAISDSLFEAGDFKAMPYYDSMALLIGQTHKLPSVIGKANYQKGRYTLEMANYKEAIIFYKNALAQFYDKNRSNFTALIYNDIGFTEGELGNYDEQVNWYLKAIRVYETLDDDLGLAQVYSNLSTAYFENENDKLAFDYAEQALTLRNKNGDATALAISYCNIANMHASKNNLEQANKYLDLGMKYAALSGDKSRLAQAYITKSLLLNGQKNIKEAFAYEQKAIALYEELENYSMVANRSIAAAFYSNALKDSVGAIKYFNQAEKLAASINNKAVTRNVYSYLTGFYKEHKNYELAYDYQKKFYLARDSILNGETATKIATLQGAFNMEKKDFEINKLQVDQKIKSLEIEKQKAIIVGNFAEAQQKQNELDLLHQNRLLQEESLKRKENELVNQKLKATNDQQQLKIAEQEKVLNEKQLANQRNFKNLLLVGLVLVSLLAILAISRIRLKKKLEQQASLLQMRNSISENLHDDIGASLSNISMLNQLAQNNINNKDKLDKYLAKAGEDIQQVSESISDIVWNINPNYDNLGNLFVRMKRYAAEMMDNKNINYKINFTEAVDNLSLDMDKRRNLYLLFKEAVNNLTKYSQANNVNMQLFIKENFLDLKIEDDGIGFDKNNTVMGNGFTNMQNRTNALNGNININSSPRKGTVIHLNFPIT